MACPTCTQVAPSSIAISKSPDIPMERSPGPIRSGSGPAWSRSVRRRRKQERTVAVSLVNVARVMSPADAKGVVMGKVAEQRG